MRITLLCLDQGVPYAGTKGCSIHLRAVAGALRRAGHDVQVVCTRAGDTALPDQPIRTVPASVTEGQLVALLREHASALVIERLAMLAPQGARASAAARVPHIYEVNAPLDVEAATFRGFHHHTEARAMFQSGFSVSRGSVAVSEAVAAWVKSLAPAHHTVRVIPNGAEPSFLDGPSAASLERARQTLGRPFGVRFGYVGSFKPWHDLESLIDAAAIVQATRPVQVVLIGHGPRASDILRRAVVAKVPVVMTGAIPHEEVPAYLSLCEVVVVPYADADAYFSPLKLVEAMALGRAAIASDTPPCREIVRHGENGLLVPPGDVDALAETMALAAANSGLRGRLGEQARADVAARHSWDHVVAKVLRFAAEHMSPAPATS